MLARVAPRVRFRVDQTRFAKDLFTQSRQPRVVNAQFFPRVDVVMIVVGWTVVVEPRLNALSKILVVID